MPNQIDITLRGLDSAQGFLLEAVQHVDRGMESYRVDSPIRVAFMILNQLDDAGLNAFEGLRRWRMLPYLGEEQFEAELALYVPRKVPEILSS